MKLSIVVPAYNEEGRIGRMLVPLFMAEKGMIQAPVFYISDYLLQSDSRNLERYEKGLAVYGKYGVFELPEGAVLRHHDRPWLDSLLAGFEPLLWSEFQVVTMNGNPARAFQWAGRKSV